MHTKSKVIVLVGPTSSGKSELAVEIAKQFDGEVVSADSRQVYRGMDLGSGKVPRDKTAYYKLPTTYCHGGVRHHLLNVASPKRTFTVYQYQRHAKRALKNILKSRRLPIICGGTGLYVDALVYDYTFPKVPPQRKLRKKLKQQPTKKLEEKLKQLDPERAKSIEGRNRRRLIRALEIIYTTGHSIPPLKKSSPYNVLSIGIKVEPSELKQRIRKRLIERINAGMVEEVKKLHKDGLSFERLYSFGLEYRYVSLSVAGRITQKEMRENIEKESSRYAKRQMTWFKRNKATRWIRGKDEALELVKTFLRNA